MSDLVEFLRARLDEDEQTATAATQGEWVWSREFVTPPGYHHRTIGPLEPGDAAFIARHSPARALAEVAAKRETIRMYVDTLEFIESLKADGMKYSHHETAAESYLNVIRNDAAAHREHPDYQSDWAIGVRFI